MDVITHAIAGTLISKAVFGGSDLFPVREMNRQRITTWALMIGAIFPDSDVLRDLFSRHQLWLINWHPSITHSLLYLPVWAIALAALTRAIARWREWEAPKFTELAGLYAVGILSHIFLDLLTVFGAALWLPLEGSRTAWDILFIVDFTLIGILLIPQFLAWAYADPQRVPGRAVLLCVIFAPAPLIASRIAQALFGIRISGFAVLVSAALLAAVFLLPAVHNWGLRVPFAAWNRAGLSLAAAYILVATYAHHVALERVNEFAAHRGVAFQIIAALPTSPFLQSLWHWDGLARGPHGVYETQMGLRDGLRLSADPENDPTSERTYYMDAASNQFIEKARKLGEVQKVLQYARFPVTRFRMEGYQAVVEIVDLRFGTMRRKLPPSFTYRVCFSESGQVLSQGWGHR
jgi:membrane-bound metal-dependent hydrolase YbcI (DUF457 family)